MTGDPQRSERGSGSNRAPGACHTASRMAFCMHTPPRTVLLLLALVLRPFPGFAQSTVVDRGTFLVTVDGRPAGSEAFVIRRAGTGAGTQVIATAEISLRGEGGRSELRPALQMVGEDAQLAAYQMKASGAQDEEVFVTAGEERFLVRLRTSMGERESELRAAHGSLVLDNGVAHHHFFLPGRSLSEGDTLPIIVPREGNLTEVRVIGSENAELQIGGQMLPSRRIALAIGGATREVWLDAAGRVLRVTDTAAGYTALRTAPPDP